MPSTYYIAWWNLENLFDEEDSPRRTEKLQRTIGSDLAGWTQTGAAQWKVEGGSDPLRLNRTMRGCTHMSAMSAAIQRLPDTDHPVKKPGRARCSH